MLDEINETISAADDAVAAANDLISETETKADEVREALSRGLSRMLLAAADLADFEAEAASGKERNEDVLEARHRYERERAKVAKLRDELDDLKLASCRARARLALLLA